MSGDSEPYDLIVALRRAQRKFADKIGGNDFVQVDITLTVWDANWEHILKVITDSDYGFPAHDADWYMSAVPCKCRQTVSAVAEMEEK